MVFNMLKYIWNIPHTSTYDWRDFVDAYEALWILGKLLLHLVYLYFGVDLSLSEKVEHQLEINQN